MKNNASPKMFKFERKKIDLEFSQNRVRGNAVP